jgi:RNA polymerase sigma-70 factor (ECF subfamily)
VNQTTLPEAVTKRLLEQRHKFVAFVQKQVSSPADAEDIVQTVFIRLVERADSIHEQASILAWFYRALRNAIIDYYRRRAVRDRGSEEFAREMRELEAQMKYDPATKNRVCQCLWPVMENMNDGKHEAGVPRRT